MLDTGPEARATQLVGGIDTGPEVQATQLVDVNYNA